MARHGVSLQSPSIHVSPLGYKVAPARLTWTGWPDYTTQPVLESGEPVPGGCVYLELVLGLWSPRESELGTEVGQCDSATIMGFPKSRP